jgi:sn1-specific diacylglycerol lipase
VLGGAVSSAISAVEVLALAPISLGETLTSTTLVAAHSSLSVLQAIFPGSDEASFSLTSFITLVRRELSEDMNDDSSPQNKYGINETMKAIVAWATLQGVTSDWQEQRWFRCLKEIRVNDEPVSQASTSPDAARVDEIDDDWIHVTEDFLYPGDGGEIITADIGRASSIPPRPTVRIPESQEDSNRLDENLKTTLRRLSKLVLAGYGGASLLFFGVPPVPPTLSSAAKNGRAQEQANLAAAIGSSEEEAARSSFHAPSRARPPAPSYSWWNVLRGRHDKDILLHYADAEPHKSTEEVYISSARVRTL